MKNINVVIGSNFGDEGKGLMTDYLSASYPNGIVVRFNGGCQAGHTVTTPKGERHVFGHIASGTFMGLPTYLSSFFVVNPMLFNKELTTLNNFGIKPKVFIDKDCIVTTPYDMLINQAIEFVRGNSRHGSCGLGFNETVTRCLVNECYNFSVKDLQEEALIRQKLKNIKEVYVENRLKELGVTIIPDNYKILFSNENIIENYLLDIRDMLKNVIVTDANIISSYDSLIFEGAQGLLLDQNHKYFPYVTRSNTGIKNVVEILNQAGLSSEKVNIVYATRAYMTRHGAGPFPTEVKGKPYEKIVDKTNVPNPYQGTLRFGLLDLEALSQTIKDDLNNAKTLDYNVLLSISCLDQLEEEVDYYIGAKLMKSSINDYVKNVFSYTGIRSGYLSYGATRDDIVILQNEDSLTKVIGF